MTPSENKPKKTPTKTPRARAKQQPVKPGEQFEQTPPPAAAQPDEVSTGQVSTPAKPVDLSVVSRLAMKPSDVKLPLPQVPTDPSAVTAWMELYRAHVELAKMSIDLEKLEADRLKAVNDIRRSKLDETVLAREQTKAEMELESLQLSLQAARRTEQTAASVASEAMVFTFADRVDGDSVRTSITTLDEWSRRQPGKPITLLLTSPGGSILHGLALYDFLLTLRHRGHELKVVAMGYAASMGSILLQAADERVMAPNGFVMLHEAASFTMGKTSTIEEDMNFLKKLEHRLVQILCERSKLTSTSLRRRWRKTDVWLDADECLALGLIDRIGVQ